MENSLTNQHIKNNEKNDIGLNFCKYLQHFDFEVRVSTKKSLDQTLSNNQILQLV